MLHFWYITPLGTPPIVPPPPDPGPVEPPRDQTIIQLAKQNVLAGVGYIGKEISKLPPRNPTTTAWTQCAAPNTEVYEIDLDVVFDFIPKDFEIVSVGNQLYNFVGSLQECQASDKSWTFNRVGTGKMYINPEGTGITEIDLDTRIVFAWFPIHLANIGVFLDGEWYDPRFILNNAQFQSKIGVSDRLFINPFLSSGAIDCWNGDGYFDTPFFDYEFLTGDWLFRHGAIVGSGSLDSSNTAIVRRTFLR